MAGEGYGKITSLADCTTELSGMFSRCCMIKISYHSHLDENSKDPDRSFFSNKR